MSSSSLEVYNKSVYAFAINHIKNMIVSVKRWNSSFQRLKSFPNRHIL
ncbi:hypothetical protein AALP_AAs52445U000100, partial [Arabis alpina]